MFSSVLRQVGVARKAVAFLPLPVKGVSSSSSLSSQQTMLHKVSLWRSFASLVNLEVPQMGDSITEGSIASVLKSAGEAVAEDEVVVQIETDKVTIDVRAPKAGVVNAMLVGEDDTVVVGQHIATIEEGAEGTASAASVASAVVEEAQPEPAAEPEEQVVVSSESRVPLIQFPPRRTQDGQVISQLSIEDRVNLGLTTGSDATQQAPTFAATSLFATFASGDTSWTKYKPNYDDHITRKAISEREIESIMLGGAAD